MLLHLGVRYLFLWALLRANVTVVGLVAGVTLSPTIGFSFRFGLLLGLVALLDEKRRGERVLLANLGISSAAVFGAATLVALTAELLVSFGLLWLPPAISR